MAASLYTRAAGAYVHRLPLVTSREEVLGAPVALSYAVCCIQCISVLRQLSSGDINYFYDGNMSYDRGTFYILFFFTESVELRIFSPCTDIDNKNEVIC